MYVCNCEEYICFGLCAAVHVCIHNGLIHSDRSNESINLHITVNSEAFSTRGGAYPNYCIWQNFQVEKDLWLEKKMVIYRKPFTLAYLYTHKANRQDHTEGLYVIHRKTVAIE